jgi:hypothetical protein
MSQSGHAKNPQQQEQELIIVVMQSANPQSTSYQHIFLMDSLDHCCMHHNEALAFPCQCNHYWQPEQHRRKGEKQNVFGASGNVLCATFCDVKLEKCNTTDFLRGCCCQAKQCRLCRWGRVPPQQQLAR